MLLEHDPSRMPPTNRNSSVSVPESGFVMVWTCASINAASRSSNSGFLSFTESSTSTPFLVVLCHPWHTQQVVQNLLPRRHPPERGAQRRQKPPRRPPRERH